MTYDEFHTGLRVLLNLYCDDIETALGRPLSDDEWLSYTKNPFLWFIRAGGEARAVYAIIEAQTGNK